MSGASLAKMNIGITATAIGGSSPKPAAIADGDHDPRVILRLRGGLQVEVREPDSVRVVRRHGHTSLAIAASRVDPRAVDPRVGRDAIDGMRTAARGRPTASRRWRASSMRC
jgi:hypothetical protein